MSHYAVLVTNTNKKSLSEQLEPFYEHCLCDPSAKWDWWVEGGRWDGFLVDKDGKYGNRCLVKDLDFDEIHVPYAFLHEGEWTEKGKMGWFGISDDKYSDEEWAKKFREFIKSLDPETEIAIVDCHI